MKIIYSLLLASLLAGCATHTPARMPSGTPFPINPEQVLVKQSSTPSVEGVEGSEDDTLYKGIK